MQTNAMLDTVVMTTDCKPIKHPLSEPQMTVTIDGSAGDSSKPSQVLQPQQQPPMDYSFTFDRHLSSMGSPKQSIHKSPATTTASASNHHKKSSPPNLNGNTIHTTNKRTKGPLNQLKARLNLNIGDKPMAKSHVFNANQLATTGHQTMTTSSSATGLRTGVADSGRKASASAAVRQAPPARVANGQPVIEHSFISDLTDVRKMENTLLTLLEDFHSGKLRAFGQDITFEKMESVREQQERLARLHFDLDVQQEVYGHQTEEGKRMAKDNMTKLIDNLQKLSDSIEQLQSKSSVANTSTSP